MIIKYYIIEIKIYYYIISDLQINNNNIPLIKFHFWKSNINKENEKESEKEDKFERNEIEEEIEENEEKNEEKKEEIEEKEEENDNIIECKELDKCQKCNNDSLMSNLCIKCNNEKGYFFLKIFYHK